MKVIGMWSDPHPIDSINAMLKNGVHLVDVRVDVRNPDEFQWGHLEGVINIPVIDISHGIDELRNNALVIISIVDYAIRKHFSCSFRQIVTRFLTREKWIAPIRH